MKPRTTHTRRDGTLTAIGFIPHHKYRGLDLPVKLDITGLRLTMDQKNSYPMPMQDGYNYVYALPGGGEYHPPT